MRLKADVDGQSWEDGQSTDAFEVGMSTIQRVRQRFVEVELDAALTRPPTVRPYECRLVAIAGSQAPEGRVSWTLRLLTDKVVELARVGSIGGRPCGKRSKDNLNPWLNELSEIPI